MLMSMACTKAFAYDIAMENEDGKTIYYNYINNSRELEVTSLSHNKYYGDIKIPETVTILNNTRKVTSIGRSAFYDCTGLTSVTIPASVTTIGSYAFEYCKGLTSVTIPASVTSIGESAFSRCSGLKKVIVKDLAAWCEISFSNDSSNPLYYAKHLYSDEDTEISNLLIPDGVTSISKYAFCNCSSLTSVTIPSSVTSIGEEAFSYCSDLTSVTIPDGVTSINAYAFQYCTGLTSLTIPGSVTSIGNYAFQYCTGLTSATISDGVTSIGGYAFSYCTGLTSVTIPASVTFIGDSAFKNTYNLKVIVKDIAAWCNISFGYPNDFYPSPFWGGNHKLYSDENTEITDLVIPDGVTSISAYAFQFCDGLTSVTIPASVTTIGKDAFANCDDLTSVTISDGVTSIGQFAFGSCKGLTSVTIPASVTSIGPSAFSGCSGLTSVTIPDGVTTIGQSAFSSCSGLTSVTIPGSVTSIGDWAFNYCDNLADFVSLIQEPFKVSNIVTNFIYNNGTLYVPLGTIEKYKATDGWKQFAWMEEGMPAGIKLPNGNTSNATEVQRYTIGGESINSPQHGINIVKMSDGTTKKVMVK